MTKNKKISEAEEVEAIEEEEVEAIEEEEVEEEKVEEEKVPQKRICISVGESLLDVIDKAAEKEDRSRSGYIARKLGALHK